MKIFFTRLIILAIILLACTIAMAQTSKPVIASKKPVPSYDPSTEKNTVSKIAEAKKIMADNTREITEATKQQNYKPSPKDAKLNVIPFFSEIPDPIASFSAAKNIDVNVKYDPFLQKIEAEKKQFAEIAVKQNKYNEVYKNEGQAGLEKRAKEQSDKSPIIKEMGGTDKVMQMSEVERKAAALQAVNNLQQNPNNPMSGFAQKYQSDPAFAARFNKMSQAEKEAELKKFMAENQTKNPNAFDAAQHEAQKNEINRNKNNAQAKIEFDLLMQRTTERLQAASDRQIRIGKKIEELVNEMKANVSARFGPLYAAVPIVELGEYGHDKDPQQMMELNIQEAKSRYIIDVQEAGLRFEAWKVLKMDYQNAIGELNAFLSNYKWGSDQGELFGTYHEDMIAAAAVGPYGMLHELGSMAKEQTDANKKKQKAFEEAINKK